MCKDTEMAKYVITLSHKMNLPINNIILQRILRDIQEEFPEKTSTPHFDGKPLIFGFGPVYPSVYSSYSSFSNRPITLKVEDELGASIKPIEERAIRRIISRWTPGPANRSSSQGILA